MEIPAEARRRIATDQVAWLITVTDVGAPAPNPVWFLPDGDDLLVFAAPGSRKVHNIAARPSVCLHFNSDPGGGDIVIVNGLAELTRAVSPSSQPGFVEKYDAGVKALGWTMAQLDAEYDTRIRITATRIRLTPGA